MITRPGITYYNYYDYRNARNDNVAPGDASGNSYIQFGPKCEKYGKGIEKMGVSVTPGICIIMMSLMRSRKRQV